MIYNNYMKLGIIVVAYKSNKMTAEYVHRELPQVDVPWVCCIVNNAATVDESNMLAESCGAEVVDLNSVPKSSANGSVFVLPSEENLGFAKGNNLGVKFLTKYLDVDYLLFSNNDIEIKSSWCISSLIDVLNRNEKIGAIGPRIIGLDGVEQPPHDGYVSPYRQIGWKLFPFLRRKSRDISEAIVAKRESGFTYWVQGSFFVMRTKDFIQVGMFDPNTFLYSEEPILAERLKQVGKQMYYENSVTVLHYEGGTIVKQRGNSWSRKMVIESNCYYYKRYLGYNGLTVWLYKTVFNRLK